MLNKLSSHEPAAAGQQALRQRLFLRRLNPADAIYPDRVRDIFYTSFAFVLEAQKGIAFELIAHPAGDIDRARLGEAFEPRRDIDVVAVDIALVDNDIACVYANAEPYPAVGIDRRLALGQFALYREAAAHRVNGAVEFDEKPVPHAADQPPAAFGYFGLNQVFYVIGEPEMGFFFIDVHQPAVTDHIRQ